jgi:hypothetical protein
LQILPWFVAHIVPSGLLDTLRHIEAPVVHEIASFSQSLAKVQVFPAAQTMHAPAPLQTFPPAVVHKSPGPRLVVATHTGAPVAQLYVPFLQSFPVGVQGSPSGHDTHEPVALQTFPPAVLHSDPGALLPVSAQT